MQDDPHMEPSPFNSIPPVVVFLFFAMFAVECIFAAGEAGVIGGPGSIGWRLQYTGEYGFNPRAFDLAVVRGEWTMDGLMRMVSYPFVHLDFVHMMFAAVIFLAMGKFVGEAMGGWVVPVIFFAASVFGAVVYAGLLDDPVWLVGAYPGAYGLIGAFTFVLWARARMTGEAQARAFTLIGFLMGIQLVFGVLFGSSYTWVAELAGFVAGFALSFLVVPGGFQALLARLRGE